MPLSRRTLLSAAGMAAVGGLPGCVTTNPATGRQSFTGTYSPADDIRIGRQEHPKLVEAFGGVYEDPKLVRYVDGVGRRLARHAEFQQFPYTFTLLDSPVVNAFALPGGYVYVSRGLLALASNEAEMAGVVAHELGHVNARHTAERLSAQQMATFGVLAGAIGASLLGLPGDTVARLGQSIAALSVQSYSRQQEFEADTLGVRYMSRAGYDPDAMVTFLSTLREQSQLEARSLGLPPGKVDEYNMMSTHPRTVDRVREAQAAAAVQRPAAPRVAREEYLALIDGMVFGDDPSQGVTIGQRFVHPSLRFEFKVPPGFRIKNSPERVLAQDTSGAAVVFDLAPVRSRSLTQFVQREWAPSASLRQLETVRINGLDGATGWAQAKTQSGPATVRLLALRRDDRSAYRLMFIAPSARMGALDGAFKQTAYSFRHLSAAEAAKIKPLRLRVRRATGKDRVTRLARALPYGQLNDAWFRVMNDMPPGAEPRPQQSLKVVEA
jgi:predicted Zn-dependent protease